MGLVMTGFLEMDDDKGKRMYYKSPLIDEPVAKINWSELIEETKEFMGKNWSTVAGEYNGRFCSDIKIVDPFTGDDIRLGSRAKTATEVEKMDYPKVFKTKRDSEIKDYESFLLKAEGDYNEKELKDIKHTFQKG
jgi:hypothetical protein